MNSHAPSRDNFAAGLARKYWAALKYVRAGYPNFTSHFSLISVFFLAIASIGAYTPYLLRQAANEAGNKAGNSHYFYIYALSYAACWTLENVLENIKGIFSAGVLARSDAALNKAIFSRILSYSYLRQKAISPGVVAQDINRAAQSFSAITTSAFWTITPIVFGFFVSISIIWNSIGNRFAILFGICVIALACLSYFIASKTGKVHSSIFSAQNKLQGYIIERLGSLLDVRLNLAQAREDRLTDSHLKKMTLAIWGANLRMGTYLGLQALAIGLVLCIFTIYSAQLNSSKSFTSGDFAMIAGYVGMLTMQLRFMSGALIDLKRSQIALQSGLKYMDAEYVDSTSIPDVDALGVVNKTRGIFSLDNLVLTIDGKTILPPISYVFKEGEFTVILAPSGAGKTTLINTMLGLLPVGAGGIEFRGIPVHCSLSSYILNFVAVAPQIPQIFNASLRFNLVYGASHSISDAELIAMLSIFEYPDLLSRNPDEVLNEMIGSNGRLLSGGERQRISIARALLRGKDALILDEPTAALNKELAEKIVRFIITRVQTLVVITHDPDIAELAQNELILPPA